MSQITSDDVAHIATLANLPLTFEETDRYAPQLSSVVSYTQKTKEMPTDGVQETSQVTGLKNVFRKDVVDEASMLTQEEALFNAPATHQGYFVVAGIFEE